MYELKAKLKVSDFGDAALDELIVLFEANGKDCTCGIVGDMAICHVEEDMLSKVTDILLRYADEVSVQNSVESEDAVFV